MAYVCIDKTKNELEKALPSTRIRLVNNQGNTNDLIILENISYNIQKDTIDVEVTDNTEQEYFDSLNRLVEVQNADLEKCHDAMFEEIKELVSILRDYQVKKVGTAARARSLLDTKYRHIG